MILNLRLTVRAIKLKDFQIFMQEEIKISDSELSELRKCGRRACWKKFKWTDKTIEKINEELSRLDLAGELVVRKPKPGIYKIFKPDEMERALNFIKEAPEGYAFQIILRDVN